MTVDLHMLGSVKTMCGICFPFVVRVYSSVVVAPAVINSANLLGMLTFLLLCC